MLISLHSLLQVENSLINHRVEIIGLDGSDHFLEHRTTANVNTTDSAYMAQGLEKTGLWRITRTQEANYTDNAVHFYTLEALCKAGLAADVDNVIHACLTRSKLTSSLAPYRGLLVIEDMIRAQSLKRFGLLLRRR